MKTFFYIASEAYDTQINIEKSKSKRLKKLDCATFFLEKKFMLSYSFVFIDQGRKMALKKILTLFQVF